MAGWATQVYSREFDAVLVRIAPGVARLLVEKITEMGRRLETFPHYRMSGRSEFRLRVDDYREITISISSATKSILSRSDIYEKSTDRLSCACMRAI